MKRVFTCCFLIIFLCAESSANAQSAKYTNYYTSVKNFDFSNCWRGDSIRPDGGDEKIAFPEPLGFIGDNYQRFYIHYIKVKKRLNNPYVYDVYGKTMVKTNVCNFKGTITIKEAVLYKETYNPSFKEGSITCDVVFYEDSTQSSTGTIKGKLTTDFCIDKKGKLYYDAILAVADGYCNNQCTATWTSYKTGKSKKCNWGDFRMPNSIELDTGVGDVHIQEKYIKNGWETFVAAYDADDDEKAKKAQQIEDAKWWE